MKAEEIREGDIVEIDYITEFTKEHINEGKALVIWKGFNNQPLVRKLDTKAPIWTCYEHIARVVGHIDIEGYMDKVLSAEPCEDCISRQEAINCVTLNEFRYKIVEDIKTLPSVTPKEKTGWIPVSERLPEEFQRVLVTIVNYKGDKVVRVAEYFSWNNGKEIFQIKENHEEWEVGEKGLLAWMPLPEPFEP